MKERLVAVGYSAGWALIKALPLPVAWWLFRTGADRAAARKGPGTQRLARNLRRVVGPDVSEAELDGLVRDGLRSYAHYWLDAFRLPKLSRQQVLDTFQMERGPVLAEAVRSGTGCVVALPHAGNWDYAGAWVCAQDILLTTVAERLKPEALYRRFVDFRASLGMEIIPMTGGSRPPMDILVDRIGESRLVPLLADRDLSARGVEVSFFGGRTRMPAGPAMLAIRTGAPLFVVSLWYEGHTPHGKVYGPVPLPPADSGPLDVRVKVLTQTVADLLAEGIAEHPAHWHMLQKLWLDEPKPEPRPEPRPAAVPPTRPAPVPASTDPAVPG
jgi:phosphatidylinositol dimannoside acyltransferase